MVTGPYYKICSKCKIKTHIDNFHVDNRRPDHRRASCKRCAISLKKNRYDQTRDNVVVIARGILNKSKGRAKKRYAKQLKRQDKLKVISNIKITPEIFDLDLEWIFTQRDKQNNKCFYTDIDMIWSIGYIDGARRINPFAISIERIDSAKGYTKDNCVLCSWWANCSKGAGTIEELIYFSSCVVKKYINEALPSLNNTGPEYQSVKDNIDYKAYEEKQSRYDEWPDNNAIIKLINTYNVTNTAKQLGVSESTLRRYIIKNNLRKYISKKLPRNKKSKIDWPIAMF